MTDDLVYTVHETALKLKCSVSTVRRMIRNGELATVPHMGSFVRIPVADVQRLVNSKVAS